MAQRLTDDKVFQWVNALAKCILLYKECLIALLLLSVCHGKSVTIVKNNLFWW